MKKILMGLFIVSSLTLLAQTEVEIISRGVRRDDSNYQNEINKVIKEREFKGWKLIDIKVLLTIPHAELSRAEYILVFEK